MIKAVIFDLDDTLYNERDFVYGGFREVARYLSLKYNLKEEEIFKIMIEILNELGRGKIFNTICDKYNLKEDISELVKIYRETIPKLFLYEDGEYILNKLKGKYKLGIITDGKASVQWNKIKALNLEKYVDKIIVTDDYGKEFCKPNEFVFKEMTKHFNLKGEECVYIGDNPNKDFIGARKVGFKTIRVIRDMGDHMKTFLSKEYEADIEIKNLKDLIYHCEL
ncbi:MAG: HAD-IA family hydrolase [Clostridiaceae bacterium]